MRFPGLMLIGALALGACGTKPTLDANDLPRTAAEFVSVYNEWDSGRMAGLFAKPPSVPAMAKQQAELAWLHEHLGACGEPMLMWQMGQKRGRFAASCERGELQMAMRLDGKGQMVGSINVAVGVDTPAPVAKALGEVLAAMPATGEAKWGKPLKAGWVRDLGRCELADVRSVTGTIGRFDLKCDNGGALLKVEIKDDGSVKRIQLWKPTKEKIRAFDDKFMG